MRYPIVIQGCDDETLVVLDLTDDEIRGVVKLARAAWIQGSEDRCKPTIGLGVEAEESFQRAREGAEFDLDYIESYTELREGD